MELPTLIRAAQQGDVDAFGTIVARFQRMAYALAYAMVGDAHLAEDAAQEAFIEAYLQLPQLREPAAFVAWFHRILFKHGDRLTRGRPAPIVGLDADDSALKTSLDLARLAADRELGQRVRAAIAELPESSRQVITLFYLADMSLKEIAATLEIPANTVKKRLFDARARLKARMEPLARDYLAHQRPAANFPLTVQFLITIRTRNLPKIRELLAADPALVHAREDAGDDTAKQYYLPLSGGYTALHRAATDGDQDLLALLLGAGADPNATTSYGLTPLHSAIAAVQTEAVRMLLAHGADPQRTLVSGMAPLHWAAIRNSAPIVELLLTHGADPAARDRHGRTARDWAELKGYRPIVGLFNRHASA
ncbi:MAG: sigma-70 family RNA polymerase sigma factor [Herpetosiphonaceae bacterium]|nr:sigma-70 family RNA polymerase sigma factor [Herpetosiphonaceae bacterium]